LFDVFIALSFSLLFPATATTMAEPDFNVFLQQRFSLNADARAQLVPHGLTDWAAFRRITETDIDNIAKAIRNPGGTIPNPHRAVYLAAIAAFDNYAGQMPNPLVRPTPPGPPETISNPGYPLTQATVHHMKILTYYLKHHVRTSRDFVNIGSTEARMQRVYDFKKVEDDYDADKAPKMPPKMDKISRIQEIIEEVEQYVESHRGSSGVFLAYLIRENDQPLPGDPYDPTVAGNVFDSFDEEMINRAPLEGPDFTIDNGRLWQLWYGILHDTEGYAWISGFLRRRDGRSAHYAVRTHYLGDGHNQRLKTKADNVIESTYYNGERANFTFETFTSRLKRAHQDLAMCNEPLSEHRKVRKMLKGIKSASLLNGPVPQIIANPTLSNNFDASVTYLTNFITETTRPTSQIASVGRGGTSFGRGRGRGRGRDFRGNGRFGRGRSGRGFSRGTGYGGRQGGRYGGRGDGQRGGRGRGYDQRISNSELSADDDYDDHTWWNVLTPTQRGRVMGLREAQRGTSAVTTDTSAPGPAPSTNAGSDSYGDRLASSITRRGESGHRGGRSA